MLGMRVMALGLIVLLGPGCAGGDSDDDGETGCTTECTGSSSTGPGSADTVGDVTGQPTTVGDGTTTGVVGTDTADTGTGSTGVDGSSTDTGDPFGCDALEFPVNVVGGGGYSTIAAAVAAAPPAAIVEVCPGTYNEALLIERPLSLLGSGAATTIIDAMGMGTVIHINDPVGPDVTIDGFSLVGGDADATPPVSGTPCGGGIAFEGPGGAQSLIVRDTTIAGNMATNGGGLCVDGTNLDATTVVLQGVTITGNTAENFGGGIFAVGAGFEITDGAIEDNMALRGGGFLVGAQAPDATIAMSGGAVRRNTAVEGGGGGYFVSGEGGMTLTLATSDWGAGERQENAPDDLACDGGTTIGFLGAEVDATCSGPPCDCALK